MALVVNQTSICHYCADTNVEPQMLEIRVSCDRGWWGITVLGGFEILPEWTGCLLIQGSIKTIT
jgi:hypothetical protein